MGKWVLDRFELLYFDLKHKRWRMFQENLLELKNNLEKSQSIKKGEQEEDRPGSYRRNIQRFLHSVRGAFGHIPKGTGITVHAPEVTDEVTFTIQVNTLRLMRSAFKKYKPHRRPDKVLGAILDYYQQVIDFEGLNPKRTEKNGVKPAGVKAFFVEFRDLINKQGFDEDVTITTNYDTILNAISILPLLSHWEIYGALYQGWTGDLQGSAKERKTLLHEVGRIREPMYAAELIYPTPGNSVAPSFKLLGYEERLQVLFQDIAKPSGTPRVIAEKDYFAYCHRPTDNNVFLGETALYLTYAAFIDSLQLLLDKSEETTTGNGLKRIFYIAYPIMTTLGRRHFLHFYLKPSDITNATLVDLWETWQRFHALIGWESLKPLIVSEMEHIDLAYFQSFLINEITPQSSDENITSRICENGHLLFPVERFSTKAQTYSYEKYLAPQDEHKKPLPIHFFLGEVWEESRSAEPPKDAASQRDLSPYQHDVRYVPEMATWDISGSPILEQLNADRCDRILVQQIELAEQMLVRKKMEIDKRKKETQKALAELEPGISLIKPDKRRVAVDAILKDTAKWRTCNLRCRKLDAIRVIYIYNKEQEYELEGKEIPEEELQTGFVLLVETDLHAFITWYLESQPVRSLTHRQEGILTLEKGFYAHYSALHASYAALIRTKLVQPLCMGKTYTKNLKSFIEEMEKEFSNTNPTPDIPTHSSARENLRSRASSVAADLFALTKISPKSLKTPNLIELYLPLKDIWRLLFIERFFQAIKLIDSYPTTCIFRLQLAEREQTEPVKTTLRLYRNCLAIAFNGENFIRKHQEDSKCKYPAAVNQVTESMRKHRIGKLFLGSQNREAWEYSQITNVDASAPVGSFWPENSQALQAWLLQQVNDKALIMMISLDGWDSP